MDPPTYPLEETSFMNGPLFSPADFQGDETKTNWKFLNWKLKIGQIRWLCE